MTTETSRMPRLRVLVVDDNRVFLSAARNLLSGLPDVSCAEYVSSAEEALTKAPGFRPDLLLMDLMMPGMGGLEAMRALCDRLPTSRIYAVTLHEAPEFRVAAMASGAHGLIPKREFAEQISALISELAGAPAKSPAVSEQSNIFNRTESSP